MTISDYKRRIRIRDKSREFWEQPDMPRPKVRGSFQRSLLESQWRKGETAISKKINEIEDLKDEIDNLKKIKALKGVLSDEEEKQIEESLDRICSAKDQALQELWYGPSKTPENTKTTGMSQLHDIYKDLKRMRDNLNKGLLKWRKDWKNPDIGHLLFTDKNKADVRSFSRAIQELLDQCRSDGQLAKLKSDCDDLHTTRLSSRLVNDPMADNKIKYCIETLQHLNEDRIKKIQKVENKIKDKKRYFEIKKDLLQTYSPDHADITIMNIQIEYFKQKLEEIIALLHDFYWCEYIIRGILREKVQFDKQTNRKFSDGHNEDPLIIKKHHLNSLEEQLKEYESKGTTTIDPLLKKAKKNYSPYPNIPITREITAIEPTPEGFTEEEFNKYMYYTQFVSRYIYNYAYTDVDTNVDSSWYKYNLEKVKRTQLFSTIDKRAANIEIEILKNEIDLLENLYKEKDFKNLNEEKREKVKQLIMLKRERLESLIATKEGETNKISQMCRFRDFIEYFQKNGEKILDYERKRFYRLENELLKMDAREQEILRILQECNRQIEYLSDSNIEKLPDHSQILDYAREVGQKAQSMGGMRLGFSKNRLYEERVASIERLRLIYRYYKKEYHPYWIPEQVEKAYKEEVNENIRIFKGVMGYACVPSITRSILLQDNSDYGNNSDGNALPKAQKLPKAFVTLDLNDGVNAKEIIFVLEKERHPIPYKLGDIFDWKYDLEEGVKQGKYRPSAPSISSSHGLGHTIAACGIELRECKDDEGRSHKVKKILVGDPFYGEFLWIRLDDITNRKRCGIQLKLWESSFPDIDTDEE